MINARKRILETTVMFVIPVVALHMLDDISINDVKTFPKYICYGMLFLAVINVIQLVVYLNKIRPIQWPTSLRWSSPFKGGPIPFPTRRVVISLVLMTAYIFTMETIGFYLAGFLYFLLILLALDPAKPSLASTGKKALYALIFMAVIYLLFSEMLGVVIPSGIAL
ncbi:tripartite tricarboxylate transporter TctB family protein [Oceanidesulfovibrio marinus]|uniref:Tripartite tricarboxylate transporter TctB family protein n=1 Tax=Oceanidesulfovibrio marinus TaxID=370038 RepID=A0A6P1ZKD1_9BACT|nr:tripartite tricarboxylate transporter TctB family protein [Oceanidesulfovibrio marinus]QJT09841.1 tripartite tricarboxylate transporter TctB family protein [Oceanidesulfovibrio marinus]TVM36043.1 hypothetical protein DQK91_05195 [Oceanidesulfovibrio marinus]